MISTFWILINIRRFNDISFEEIWKSIKLNFLDATQIYQAKQAAIGLAEEAVQCAAVCERFLETLGGINGDEK